MKKIPGVSGVSRRGFLQASVVAGAGVSLAATQAISQSDPSQSSAERSAFDEATIAQLQAAMDAGRTSAVELTNHYLNRILAIDEKGPHLNSVIEINPDGSSWRTRPTRCGVADACSARSTAFRSC